MACVIFSLKLVFDSYCEGKFFQKVIKDLYFSELALLIGDKVSHFNLFYE